MSMMKKPKILITNDDGIDAPGIRHLAKALTDFCELYIVAPASEKSGVGLGITIRDPLRIHPVQWENNTPAWKITGTPADCVRMGTSVLLDSPPDLILSGINKGSNSGRTLLYSGTVAGVIEGVMRGIPGIAFSCDGFLNPQYSSFEKYVFPLVSYLLAHPMPAGSFLNVNFPDVVADQIKGCKLARQGKSIFKENPDKRPHPEGDSYFWMGFRWEEHEEHDNSDVELLKQGYVTVVPIQVHELTNHHILDSRKEHFETLFNP